MVAMTDGPVACARPAVSASAWTWTEGETVVVRTGAAMVVGVFDTEGEEVGAFVSLLMLASHQRTKPMANATPKTSERPSRFAALACSRMILLSLRRKIPALADEAM